MEQFNLNASVEGNATEIHVLIIGAGRGGLAFLDVLAHYDWIHVDALVDQDPQAHAFSSPKSANIDCIVGVEHALAGFTGDVIIDVTGDPEIRMRLRSNPELQKIEIISGQSAKLMFDLVFEQIQDKCNMQSQNERLDLLGTLLDTSMKLESETSLSQLAHQSMSALHTHIRGTKGIAVLFEEPHHPEIIGAVALEQPILTPQLHQQLSILSHELAKPQHHFHQLADVLTIPDAVLNVLIPVWHKEVLIAAVLFEVLEPITNTHQAILNTTKAHLNMAAKNLYQRKDLEDMAFHDGLTHAFNRRYLMQKMSQETSRARRNKHTALACAFVDLDFLKKINDKYGHQAGDQALKYVVDCIHNSVREYDLVARYGGDEFVALMSLENKDALRLVEEIGERILQLVRSGSFPEYENMQTSVSIGIAVQSSDTLDRDTLLESADKAAYQAKTSGRNRLHVTMDM